MDDVVKTFERLWNRKASEEEARRLHHIQNIIGIRSNDAIWALMLALEHYQQLYQQMPQKIEDAGRVAVNQIKDTAMIVAASAAVEAKQELAGELAKVVQDVADRSARKQHWQWIGVGLSCATMGIIGTGWTAFERGREAGVGIGYQEARTEGAAAAWGASPDGRLAFRMAQAGSLQYLARCSQPGWEVSNGVCFAKVGKDGNLYGWRVPR